MKVVNVKALSGYKLHVVFDDGISGTVDLKDFVATGIFSSLKNEAAFNKVYTTNYSIAWSEELEIDALAVYAEIVNKSPQELLSGSLTYAAN